MTPVYRVTIAQKIKEYRKQHKLSQSEFGRLIGVSAQAVYKWEQEICYPDITFLPHLAEILGCSTDEFFKS
ncbi:MAG: helix-turn-helix transcriptional regulator [Clostridia bacterium]|nr:helix-turn-helix transcriptional regulator [Clostridia bacterium]